MNLRAASKAVSNMGSRLMHRAIFTAKKNSPLILMITAGVTGLGCVVSACVATKQLDPVLEQHNRTLEETKQIIANEPEHFTEKQGRRMIAKVYGRTALKVAQLYIPAFLLGATAVGCAAGGYKIQANRITYLSGALAAAERRIQMMQAKEQAEELEKIADPEERRKKAEEFQNNAGNEAFMTWWGAGDDTYPDPQIYGPYAPIRHLKMLEDYYNKVLPIWGDILWSDVLLALHKPRDNKSRMGGWHWNPDGGDHQVDFGLQNARNAVFMSGETRDGVWLIPNCENSIMGKMPLPSTRTVLR